MDWGYYFSLVAVGFLSVLFSDAIRWYRNRRNRWACSRCGFQITTANQKLREDIAAFHLMNTHRKVV